MINHLWLLITLAAAVAYTNQPPAWPLDLPPSGAVATPTFQPAAITALPLPGGGTQTFWSPPAPVVAFGVPPREVAIRVDPPAPYRIDTSVDLLTWERGAWVLTNAPAVIWECDVLAADRPKARFWRVVVGEL